MAELDLDELERDALKDKPAASSSPAPDPLADLTAGKPSLDPAANARAAADRLPKEPERQFNVGNLPESVIQAIEDFAHDNRMNRKTLVLTALKEKGVPIPDDLLRDRRRRR